LQRAAFCQDKGRIKSAEFENRGHSGTPGCEMQNEESWIAAPEAGIVANGAA